MAHASSTSRSNRPALLSREAKAACWQASSKATGGALMALAAAIFAALSTYNSSDPSWNTASGEAPANFLGGPGALLADALLQGFGFGAGVAVLLLGGWGFRIWHRLGIPNPRRRIGLGILALACMSAGFAAFPPPGIMPLNFSMGGAVGAFVLAQLVNLTNLAAFLDVRLVGLVIVALTLVLLKNVLLVPREALVASGQIAATVAVRSASSLWRTVGWFGSQANQLRAKWQTDASPDDDYLLPLPLHEPDEDTPPAAPQATSKKRSLFRKAGAEIPVEVPAVATDSKAAVATKAAAARKPRRGAVVQYILPPLELLAPVRKKGPAIDKKTIDERKEELSGVLSDFGVNGDVIGANPGPVVTLFELEPARGVKSARVISLADDIARSMSAVSARVAVVPGRNIIGIELPNPTREMVLFREMFDHAAFAPGKHRLPLALGKDIGGTPVVVDLAKMPHLLVAGTTGSGKSVSVNTMILSLLYRLTPEECRFIMVDPKMLELSVYDGIPHLLAPVVTDPKKAVVALKWTVKEMEQRYYAMSRLGVRNIEGYNQRIKQAQETGEVLSRRVQTGFDPETGKPVYEDQPLPLQPLPYIVVIVDEMADLMLVAGKDIEAAIQRLAQMARAAGIHLIMATQRPSVDVITGTIKANFPTRISFQVTSKIDSRTILGEQGAEQLLGQGDMLYMAGGGRISRIHGPFVSDGEVEAIVAHLKTQGAPDYVEDVTIDDEEEGESGSRESSGDALYDQAVAIVIREGKVSTSFIQRHLQIGYNRAARIVEQMEEQGVISKPNHAGKREILGR